MNPLSPRRWLPNGIQCRKFGPLDLDRQTVGYLALPLIAVLGMMNSACGGGGGESTSPSGRIGWVDFTSPASSGAYQTDRPTVTLSGLSFTSGNPCDAIAPFNPPPGYEVTWSNGATGQSGYADVGVNCLIVVGTHWDAVVPLALGTNPITVTASDGVGNSGAGAIVVTRVPDTTPPTVTSTFPDAGANSVSTATMISIMFSESLDPNSAMSSSAITVADSGNNTVPGSVSYDYGVTVNFLPAQALQHGMTYRVTVSTGILDVNLNPLAAPYVFSFTTL